MNLLLLLLLLRVVDGRAKLQLLLLLPWLLLGKWLANPLAPCATDVASASLWRLPALCCGR